MRIKVGQTWIDNKTGNVLIILRKKGDQWQCQLKGSGVIHKMNEYIIKKYYCLKTKDTENRPKLRELLLVPQAQEEK